MSKVSRGNPASDGGDKDPKNCTSHAANKTSLGDEEPKKRTCAVKKMSLSIRLVFNVV